MSEYYAGYQPKNEQHFRDMLDQFRKAPNSRAMKNVKVLWILSPDVDRQDILVAFGRVERERVTSMNYAGWKEPVWDDALITVPRRVLQEADQALDDTRGLIQRLNSHETAGCCKLDTRDRRALKWGYRALASIRKILMSTRETPSQPKGEET